MKLETISVDFTDEQKRYLEGFAAGVQIMRGGRGLAGGATAAKADAEPAGPDAAHIKAQDEVMASGKKLADQEKFKREEHPFDAYQRLKQQALDNAPPTPADNFRWRYFGLFYVAPAQTPTCAGCGCRTAFSSTGNSLALPISPKAMAAATPTSPPAPICRSARSCRRTR